MKPFKSVLTLLFTCILMCGVLHASPPTKYQSERFTVEKLVTQMKAEKIRFTDVVLAQALLESGEFTSRIFKRNHNLFGMKKAEYRTTTAIGTRYGHARYECWQCSVQDYALLQQNILRKHPSFNRSQYLSYISKRYAKNRHYNSLLKKRIKLVNNLYYDLIYV